MQLLYAEYNNFSVRRLQYLVQVRQWLALIPIFDWAILTFDSRPFSVWLGPILCLTGAGQSRQPPGRPWHAPAEVLHHHGGEHPRPSALGRCAVQILRETLSGRGEWMNSLGADCVIILSFNTCPFPGRGEWVCEWIPLVLSVLLCTLSPSHCTFPGSGERLSESPWCCLCYYVPSS